MLNDEKELVRKIINNSKILPFKEIEKENSDKAFISRNGRGIVFNDNKTFENYLKLQDRLYENEIIARNYTKEELKNNLADKLIYSQEFPENIYEELLDIEEYDFQYFIPIRNSSLSKIYYFDDVTIFPINSIVNEISEHSLEYLEEKNIQVLASTFIRTNSRNRGKELANEQIKNLIYIIRIFSFSLSGKRNLSIDDHITTDSVAIIKTPEKEMLNLSKVGAKLPLNLDLFFSAISKEIFDKIIKIINRDAERNEIESRIYESIQWVGEGLSFIEINDRFTRTMIGIESLIEQKEKNLTDKMAKRAAFMIKDDMNNKEIYDIFKKLYDKRSTLIHGSIIEIGLYDLKKGIEIYRSILFWLVDNSLKIKSIDDLDKHIDSASNSEK